MKEYLCRLKSGSSKGTIALWWIFRLLLIYAFAMSLFEASLNSTVPVRIALSFLCTFLWEICMASPKKSCLRFMPASLQTVIILEIFLSAFVGIFLNFNYSTVWFDPLLQFIGAATAVFAGYELSWAIIKKQRSSATKAMMFYVAFGVGFIAVNLVELFEFSFDQIVGMATGMPSDLQHWSLALAEGTARGKGLINSIDPSRWPLMATMADIILSTISAFVALLILNIYPYRNKGKFRYNTDFEAVSVAAVLEKEKIGLKPYFERLKNSCPKGTYLLWWAIRLAMVGLFVRALILHPETTDAVEVLMNLATMFIWEFCVACPPKNVFRYISYHLQTIITVCVFITVVAGQVLNFYYEVKLWDSALHFLSGIIAVYFGYEITCALFKMERRTASLTLVIIASVGFCFMCTTFWEIFEFSCDQVVGMMTGVPNDVQHWSFALAEGTAKEITIIDPIVHDRWPLMDTMIDIVLNTVGAFLGCLGLVIYPYRHKGKAKFDFDFKEQIKA